VNDDNSPNLNAVGSLQLNPEPSFQIVAGLGLLALIIVRHRRKT
jgi:hypothetical protein